MGKFSSKYMLKELKVVDNWELTICSSERLLLREENELFLKKESFNNLYKTSCVKIDDAFSRRNIAYVFFQKKGAQRRKS